MSAQAAQTKATTADQAFWTLDPFVQVHPGDPWHANLERFFADDEYALIRPLTRRLDPRGGQSPYKHVAVVGHRGAGKTTMVRGAMAELERAASHLPVYVDVIATLDISDFRLADVLVTIVNAVVSTLEARSKELPASELRLFERWFADEERVEVQERGVNGSLATTAEATGGIPWLAKLTAKASAQLRADTTYRQQVRSQVERDPRELLSRTNQVLDAASKALGRALVVVFDNLEKVNDRSVVERAVLQRADELRGLRTSMVLFLHPADQYAPLTIRADEAFETITVPMLPIRRAQDGYDVVSGEAIQAVTALLGLRVDLDRVFEHPTAAVQQLVRHSGGRLRDVIELARRACELAGAGQVTERMIEKVARKMAGDRASMQRPGDLDRLVTVARRKRVPSDDDHGYLLLHSLVLQYNGQPWWDIHPLLLLDAEIEQAVLAPPRG